MYGIVGWVEFQDGAAPGALEPMIGAARPGGTVARHALAAPHGEVALVHGLYPVALHGNGEVTAVLLGAPTWSEPALAALARDRDGATALAEGFQRFGRGVLERMHGPFALVLITREGVLAAIDRAGIHTLSFALRDGVFAFGTSARSVAAHPNIGATLDPQALFHYFYFREVPSPGTVFQGVEKLRPGELVALRDGRLEREFYWRLHYVDAGAPSLPEYGRRLRDLLREAVDALRDKNGPQAAFLSGGIDSSTVSGLLAGVARAPVHTYSMGFDVPGFDEMEYARLAATRFGTELHAHYVTPEEVAEGLPVVARTFDEPFANESAVSVYLLARRARADGVAVLLGGDGGDEIFGGNARYAKQMVFEHYGRVPDRLRRGVLEPLAFGLRGGQSLWPIRKARSYIEQARVPLPDRMETYNPLHREPLVRQFEAGFLARVDPERPLEWLRDPYFRADAEHPINRMLHLDLKFTLADNDLRKVSRMCEAAGVEVRYPMLADPVVEFSGLVPANYKVRRGVLRWFYKEAMRDFLPAEILHKKKHGFGLPFGEWVLTHAGLEAQVSRLLDAFAERGILRPEYLADTRRRHAGEHATYYGGILWNVVVLEQWLQEHGF